LVIRRGEIRWADLGEPRGSEPGYRRPTVVVQSDAFNRSRISTVVVVALTSNLELARAPGNVLLPRSVTGLLKDFVANVSQLLTLDKGDLDEDVVGCLSRLDLESIEDGLELVLDLEDR
jgi:mRNA interferase MazF